MQRDRLFSTSHKALEASLLVLDFFLDLCLLAVMQSCFLNNTIKSEYRCLVV